MKQPPAPRRPVPATRPVRTSASARTQGAPASARTQGAPRSVPAQRSPNRAVVSAGSAARFAERAELQRRLSRRRAYRVSGAAAIVLALGWLAFFSPVFRVDPARVVVTGGDAFVDQSAIRSVVAAQAAGVPLPRLNTPALRDRLLEVPGVREARVTRVWPQGLAILLVARQPVVAVPTGGQHVLLDIDGVQVGRSKKPGTLPVVSVPTENPRTLRAVLDVLAELPATLAREIATVGADSEDTVRMVLRDGVTVVWGSADDTALKIRVLGVLRTAAQTKSAKVFDVSAPTLPITRS